MTTQRPVNLTLHLDAPVQRLRADLQQALDHLQVCLAALDHAPSEHALFADDGFRGAVLVSPDRPGLMPGAQVYHRLGPSLERPVESARTWLVGCALRDVLAAYQLALEDSFAQATLIRAIATKDPTKTVGWMGDVLHKRTDEAEKFHYVGLPKKLAMLWQALGAAPPASLSEAMGAVGSLVGARNCLEHRQGLVDERDTGENDTLTVRWVALRAFLIGADGSRTEARLGVEPGYVEEMELKQRHPVERSFRRGDRIRFSVADVSDMCYSLSVFAEDVQRAIAAIAGAAGIEHVGSPPS